MKTTLAIALALMLCASAQAADTKADPKKDEMMKQFMQYATPGEAHKTLAAQAGKWNFTQTMWETPDSAPMISQGKSTMKMIMGGRYLQQEISSKAMGMPFSGLGFTGFNNLTQKYETLWLDNFSTGMMHGEGAYDAAAKVLSDEGEFSCPMTKGPRKYRSEWKIVDKNNMIYSMWSEDIASKKDYKMMEIQYKRAR